MTEYRLEGGRRDGERVTIDGDPPHVLRMPVSRPVEIPGKVVSFRRSRFDGLTIDVDEYVRTGHVFRWDGLIGDAWAEMDVSAQVLTQAGAAVRYEVRRQMRRRFEALDPDKVVDRIVWRVAPDRMFRYRLRAFVGPTRVQRGLLARDERQAAADRLDEVIR